MDVLLPTTPEQIIKLPVTPRERSHTGRKRKPYHVFLSYYFLRYSELCHDKKWDLVGGVVRDGIPSVIDVVRKASNEWRILCTVQKGGGESKGHCFLTADQRMMGFLMLSPMRSRKMVPS